MAAAHTPKAETPWRRRYKPSPSFLSLHLGVDASVIPEGFHCHHLLLEDWAAMESEQGVIFVSIPTLLDPSLAPEGRHIVHTFTPSDIQAWKQLSPADYKAKKAADAARLVQRLEAILPGLGGAIRHQEIGTPRTHRRFLGRMGGSSSGSTCLAQPHIPPPAIPRARSSRARRNRSAVMGSRQKHQGRLRFEHSGQSCASQRWGPKHNTG